MSPGRPDQAGQELQRIFQGKRKKKETRKNNSERERDRLAVLPLQVNNSSSEESQIFLVVTRHSHSNRGDPSVGMHNRSFGHRNLPRINLFPEKGTGRVRLSQNKRRGAS